MNQLDAAGVNTNDWIDSQIPGVAETIVVEMFKFYEFEAALWPPANWREDDYLEWFNYNTRTIKLYHEEAMGISYVRDKLNGMYGVAVPPGRDVEPAWGRGLAHMLNIGIIMKSDKNWMSKSGLTFLKRHPALGEYGVDLDEYEQDNYGEVGANAYSWGIYNISTGVQIPVHNRIDHHTYIAIIRALLEGMMSNVPRVLKVMISSPGFVQRFEDFLETQIPGLARGIIGDTDVGDEDDIDYFKVRMMITMLRHRNLLVPPLVGAP